MPTENNKDQFPTPDWKYWRRIGNTQLWYAALLSLNIEPRKFKASDLKINNKSMYDEYRLRRVNLIDGYNKHENLRNISFLRDGTTPSGKRLYLCDVLLFAKSNGWENLNDLEAGINGTIEVEISEDSITETFTNVDSFGKGAKYEAIRFAAVVKILESFLNGTSGQNKAAFLNGKTINQSALGLEITKYCTKDLTSKSSKPAGCFSSATNRRRIGEALKLLEAHLID